MRFSIFTPSFNKPEYVLDAIKSIMGQTYQDFEYWILENSTNVETRKVVREYLDQNPDPRVRYLEINFTPERRKEAYPTALLLNEFYLKANGEYIVYLSDDDLLYPNCLEVVNNFFTVRTDVKAAYFSQQTMKVRDDGTFERTNDIRAKVPRGLTLSDKFDCQVDGGQVIHRKDCLDKLIQPFFAYEYKDASHCDGLFLEQLGTHFLVEPIEDFLGEHRVTRKSTWTT